jgi:uncharacterized NAD(P)/FAD-binding protein YdhS
MSLFEDEPTQFLEYARRVDGRIHASEFLPRRLYGDYLAVEVTHALELAAARGHRVDVWPGEAEALVPDANGVTVFRDGIAVRADAAVLAIGTLPPRPLHGVSDAAIAGGHYVVDPWLFLADACHDLTPRNVVLIGSGLTAIDVVLELAALWPKARFTAISRHGRFPEAHLVAAPASPPQVEPGMVDAMLAMPNIRAWTRLVRRAIERGPDWRATVDSLRPYTVALWQGLPQKERARFLRHVRWAWDRARHRMPPRIQSDLRRLQWDGRLYPSRGRLHSADVVGGRLRLEIVPPACAYPIAREADLVIQAAGLDTEVRQTRHPLVVQLIANGFISPDPLGLGCEATPDGRLMHGRNSWPHLYAMGGLLRGVYWESTSMPEIRQQAHHLADRLVSTYRCHERRA